MESFKLCSLDFYLHKMDKKKNPAYQSNMNIPFCNNNVDNNMVQSSQSISLLWKKMENKLLWKKKSRKKLFLFYVNNWKIK